VLRRRGKAQWLEPDDARVRGPIVLHPPTDAKAIVQGEDELAWIGIVIGASYLFFLVFEQPFMKSAGKRDRQRQDAAPMPVT